MKKRQLLIATTNEGKAKEIKTFLGTALFDCVSLSDLPNCPAEPEETEPTIEGNAMLKAKYYAEQTGLLSLADDGGMFVDALDGWPGVKSARIAENATARYELVLEKLEGLPKEQRTASFRVALALYDPQTTAYFMSIGNTEGSIRTAPSVAKHGFGYDPIFIEATSGKTYAEMTMEEKNAVSHRGKALQRMKYHLDNTYKPKEIVVPVALIVQNGKILLTLRNDPHRPAYHHKWEFPGGGVERGEQLHDTLIREAAEEAGHIVEVIKLLQHIAVEIPVSIFSYRVYIIPYVCRVKEVLSDPVTDPEIADVKWFPITEVGALDLIGENKTLFNTVLPELNAIIAEYQL